jgi:flagellar biosynthesis protein FlhB
MEQSSQDRNLPASDRKLKKARDDGQVARSRDLGHLAVLGTGAVSLMGLAPFMFEKLRHLLGRQLTFDATFLTQPDSALSRLSEMVAAGLAGCAVFGAIIMLVAMLSSVATGG